MLFSDFLKRIGADTRAKYVWFKCAEGYTNTLDMPTLLHPQTQLTLKYDNKTLPRAYGFPIKIRTPTKLGFKQPKHVVVRNATLWTSGPAGIIERGDFLRRVEGFAALRGWGDDSPEYLRNAAYSLEEWKNLRDKSL